MSGARLFTRTLGELLITAGALVLLFVVWQVWWTDVQAQGAADQALEQVQASFAEYGQDRGSGSDTGTLPDEAEETADPVPTTAAPTTIPPPEPVRTSPPTRTAEPEPPARPTYRQGDGVAIVHLPTLDQVVAVQEGIELEILNRGVLGHYPHSALPGEIGNFAVAGHRTTYGAPMWDLDALQPGDPVVVETTEGWSVYLMQRHRVVLPHQVEVVAAVPDQPGVEPTEAWMVLTACHPRFSAEQRLIGYALLDRTVPRADGPPPELGAT